MHSDLKELLIRHMLVTREQVDWATQSARGSRCTWLEQLLVLGILNEERVCECVSTQVCLPRCDPRRLANLPADVVARLPADVAVEHRVLPLWLEPDGDLRIGMIDPLDQAAFEEVQFFAGRRVLREVVAATALAWALHHYHGVRSALWPRGPSKRSWAPSEEDPRVLGA
jgi:Type II secretion system (T2SS), protein E, N-terminal domain